MKNGFCPLASGSKGNSIYFATEKTKILIDAGISGKATEKKLAEIGVHISEIQAILITHDHFDHVQGVAQLGMKHKIPIFSNVETAKGIYALLGCCPKFKIFTTGEKFSFCDLEIHPFSIQHDTVDPVAFTIRYENLKVGICTDLGFVTTLVRKQLEECDYLFIEANHEPDWVHASSRPMELKKRILGKSGHLSNEACAHLLKDIKHQKLRHIHLAHLSQECNSPQKALEVVKKEIGDEVPITIAYQDTVGKPIAFT